MLSLSQPHGLTDSLKVPFNVAQELTHPSDVTGISVECALGLSVVELAAVIPHGQVGVTTVGEIRNMGGDVIRTSGRSLNHATLTGLNPEQISNLLTPTIPNPTRQQSSFRTDT